MGFFSDLFKSEKNWSYDELAALSAVLIAMSAADGEIDEEEKKVVTNALINLDDGKIKDWGQFADYSLSIRPEKNVQVLKNMHSTKRKIVVGLLAAVGLADGEEHASETELFQGLRRHLEVK